MEIKKELKKNIFCLTLNREKKLNALTYEGVRELDKLADEIEKNPKIKAVLMEGKGSGFCAGGDIRQVYEDYLAQDHFVPEFFHDEYVMDQKFASLTKPVICHWKGYVMGGGVGLSIGSRFRIADETLRWAMPEADLGIVPDVGTGYYFSKMPRGLALHLTLTGREITGSDAKKLNLATHYICSKDYPKLREDILAQDYDLSQDQIENSLESIISQYETPVTDSSLDQEMEKINGYYDKNSLEEIVEGLKNAKDSWAKKEYEILMTRCPKSLVIIYQRYEKGKDLTREEHFQLDEKILLDAMKDGNMKEGIYGKIIDKNYRPRYRPSSIEEVDRDLVERLLTL